MSVERKFGSFSDHCLAVSGYALERHCSKERVVKARVHHGREMKS